MLKFFGMSGMIFTALLLSMPAGAQEDCDCGHSPYVYYHLSDEVELDENPWQIMSVEHFDIDLTKEDESAVCLVDLKLIPESEPFLFQDIQNIPEGDLEFYWNGKWILASEFENQMDASECSIEGAQS